jgi:hypothetical protein
VIFQVSFLRHTTCDNGCHKKVTGVTHFLRRFSIPKAMFATVLRNQARTALVLSRARLPVTSLLLSNRTLPISRPLLDVKTQDLRRWYNTELGREDSSKPQHATIWVGNLPFFADDADIREKFSEFGRVQQVRLGKQTRHTQHY